MTLADQHLAEGVFCRHITDRNEWLRWRRGSIGASEVAAVFGASPFVTPLDLFIAKTQGLATVASGVMVRGLILEAAGLAALGIERPEWRCTAPSAFLIHTDRRLSATPDFSNCDREPVELKAPTPPMFKREWGKEPPLHYQLQALTQAMLTGAPRAWIAALVVDGFSAELYTFEIPRNAAVEDKIIEGVAAFWRRIDENDPPPPTFGSDSTALAALYPDDRGPMLDMTTDNRLPLLISARSEYAKIARENNALIDEIDDEIKDKIGDALGAFGDGWKATWKTEHRASSWKNAKSFRVLRVHDKRKATNDV